jgi:Icc protein
MPEILLTFVHISDTHISPDSEYGTQHGLWSAQEGAKALVRAVNELPFQPDFVLHTGDVAYGPDPDAYHTAREILTKLKSPLYYLAGNHDHADALQRILLGRTEVISPFHYRMEVNGVQIVCLDTNGHAEPPRGNIAVEQLDWLDSICSTPDAQPLIVAMHHNPLSIGSPWLDDYMRLINGEVVHRILLKARDRLHGVFFGHVHQNISYYRDGILYTSALSSWNQFLAYPGLDDTIPDLDAQPGFNVVTLTRNQTFVRQWYFRVK